MSITAKNYLHNILDSLNSNFTIHIGQFAYDKPTLLKYYDTVIHSGLLQQSIDRAQVQSGKSSSTAASSTAAREKSYNDINKHALQLMMNTSVVKQDQALMHVLSAYFEILNIQTGRI